MADMNILLPPELPQDTENDGIYVLITNIFYSPFACLIHNTIRLRLLSWNLKEYRMEALFQCELFLART